jgi:hypothetical protein
MTNGFQKNDVYDETSHKRDGFEPKMTQSSPGRILMKVVQKIEAGVCVAIALLLTTGWVVAIGQLFARPV